MDYENPSNELTWSLWTLIGIAVLFSLSCIALIIARIFFKEVLHKYCSCCPCYAIRKDFTTLQKDPSDVKKTLHTDIHHGSRNERNVQTETSRSSSKMGKKPVPNIIITEPSGKQRRPTTTTVVTLPGTKRLTGIQYNKVITQESSTIITSQSTQIIVPQREDRSSSQNQNVPVAPEAERKRLPSPVWSTPHGNIRSVSLPSIVNFSDIDKASSVFTLKNSENEITTSPRLESASPQDVDEVQDKGESILKDLQNQRQITPVPSVLFHKPLKEIKVDNSKDFQSDGHDSTLIQTSPQDVYTRQVVKQGNLTDSKDRRALISESALIVRQEKEINKALVDPLVDSLVEENVSQLPNTSSQSRRDGILVRADLTELSERRIRNVAHSHPTFPQSRNVNPPSANTNIADNSNAAGNNAQSEPANLTSPMEVRRLILQTGNLPDEQIAGHRANVRFFDWSMDLLEISQRSTLEEDPAPDNDQ